jgi:hypothetical protein
VDPLGATGLGEKLPEVARDHNSVVMKVKESVKQFTEVIAVSEVQGKYIYFTFFILFNKALMVTVIVVYYRDDGHIVVKVDVVMNPSLTIQQAHRTSVKV